MRHEVGCKTAPERGSPRDLPITAAQVISAPSSGWIRTKTASKSLESSHNLLETTHTTSPKQGTTAPLLLSRYLKRAHDAVEEAKELAPGATLSLIGHSAGGWLARVYMQEFGPSHISLLLTLGTPHLPPPKGVLGVIDQTRGLLDYVENNCSKAVYTPQLKYVCIAGRSLEIVLKLVERLRPCLCIWILEMYKRSIEDLAGF